MPGTEPKGLFLLHDAGMDLFPLKVVFCLCDDFILHSAEVGRFYLSNADFWGCFYGSDWLGPVFPPPLICILLIPGYFFIKVMGEWGKEQRLHGGHSQGDLKAAIISPLKWILWSLFQG